MIQLNKTYLINNGQANIIFSEGKKGTINATYQMSGKKDTGIINATLSDNYLSGTYHNKIGNSTGLIEFKFYENGFDCKWKSGLEPGPMRGKWKGLLEGANASTQSESIDNSPIVGIFSANYDEDYDEWTPCYDAEEMPYLAAIGFFAQHLPKTENEWYGFVGYVVTNTCDKFRTESVLFMTDSGQTVCAHDMGGEAITEEGLDLVEAFKNKYPMEWSQIMALYDKYFYCTEEQQDEDTIYLSLTENIPANLHLENIYGGDWLDLEIVKKSNGFSLETMIELNGSDD